MRKRWSYTYRICENADVARRVCDNSMRGLSYYVRKNYPAHFALWRHADPQYAGYYIAWVPGLR